MKTADEIRERIGAINTELLKERCDCGCEDDDYYACLKEKRVLEWVLDNDPENEAATPRAVTAPGLDTGDRESNDG